MDSYEFMLYLGVMAGVTYLVRVIPFVLVKNKIENKYIKSFLGYIPYAVLAAMTIPGVFYSTRYFLSALCGFVTAVVLAYFGKSLITVALSASLAVFLSGIVIDCF